MIIELRQGYEMTCDCRKLLNEWISEYATNGDFVKVYRETMSLFAQPKQEPVYWENEKKALLNEIDHLTNRLAQPEQEPVSKCIKIIDDIKEVAIENEWNIDEAMSSAVLDIMKHFNMLNGVDNE